MLNRANGVIVEVAAAKALHEQHRPRELIAFEHERADGPRAARLTAILGARE
jgi:hypothetical protein